MEGAQYLIWILKYLLTYLFSKKLYDRICMLVLNLCLKILFHLSGRRLEEGKKNNLLVRGNTCPLDKYEFLSLTKVPPSAGYHVHGMSFPEAKGSSDPVSASCESCRSLCRAVVGIHAKW